MRTETRWEAKPGVQPGGSPRRWGIFLMAMLSPVGCDEVARDGADVPRILRVGYSQEPPFSFLDTDGRVTGEGPELFRLVANRLELPEPEWIGMPFGDLLPELERGRIDAVAAGLFRTPEREARGYFAGTTFCVEPFALVRANASAPHLDRIYLGDASVSVAVISGGVEEGVLEKPEGMPSHLFRAPDLTTALAALRMERVEAVLLSSPTARWVAAEAPGTYRSVGPLAVPEPAPAALAGCGGPVFRLSDPALAHRWASELEEVVGSEAHRSLVEPLGFGPRDLPPGGGS